jgi:hypothetical protein
MRKHTSFIYYVPSGIYLNGKIVEHIANIEQIVYSGLLALPGQGPLRCWPSDSRP